MRSELYVEKRRCERHEHRCPLNLYRMDEQEHTYYAEMKDYSENGISLVTGEKLVIGQFLYLEIKEFDKNYNGIVKWKTPISSAKNRANGLYRYGVEYSISEDCIC